MKVNVAALEKGDFDYLLSPCASCTSTIKELWPRYAGRLGSVAQRKAEELAAKAMDINAFLVDVLKVHPAEHAQGNAVTVTYHDSCHLKKSLGVTQPAPGRHCRQPGLCAQGNGRGRPLLRLRRLLQPFSL